MSALEGEMNWLYRFREHCWQEGRNPRFGGVGTIWSFSVVSALIALVQVVFWDPPYSVFVIVFFLLMSVMCIFIALGAPKKEPSDDTG